MGSGKMSNFFQSYFGDKQSEMTELLGPLLVKNCDGAIGATCKLFRDVVAPVADLKPKLVCNSGATTITAGCTLNEKMIVSLNPEIAKSGWELDDEGDLCNVTKKFPVCSKAVDHTTSWMGVCLLDESGAPVLLGLRSAVLGSPTIGDAKTTLAFKMTDDSRIPGVRLKLNKKSSFYPNGHNFRLRLTMHVWTAYGFQYYTYETPAFTSVARNITDAARDKKRERDRMHSKTRVRGGIRK